MSQSPRSALPAIHPKRVRYIKLGKQGSWEPECLDNGIIRFGFGTARSDKFKLSRAAKWEKLRQLFIAQGESKGNATRFTKETRLFFEDHGYTLWITFARERLWWGLLTASPPEPHDDGDGVWRSVAGGWRDADRNGEQLTKDRLSGALTKLAAYRGTSCDVDVADYVIGRINGEKRAEVDRALAALEKIRSSALDLMKFLGPRDFETLVDLVFTSSGWRRLGVVGRTQKTLDLDLMLPSTGERAFVQVKSQTTPAEFDEYVRRFEDDGTHDRMFYVFHSGRVETDEDDSRVIVIGPQRLAELVVKAGLVEWLIDRVS